MTVMSWSLAWARTPLSDLLSIAAMTSTSTFWPTMVSIALTWSAATSFEYCSVTS